MRKFFVGKNLKCLDPVKKIYLYLKTISQIFFVFDNYITIAEIGNQSQLPICWRYQKVSHQIQSPQYIG